MNLTQAVHFVSIHIYYSEHTVSVDIFMAQKKHKTSNVLGLITFERVWWHKMLLKSSSNSLYFYTLTIAIRAIMITSILHFYCRFHPRFPH